MDLDFEPSYVSLLHTFTPEPQASLFYNIGNITMTYRISNQTIQYSSQ